MRDLSADAVVDAAGNTVLTGQHHRDETFPTLALATAPGRRLVIEDSTFERCRTEAGFFLTASVTLRGVTFVDLDCGDALRVSAQAELAGVTVAGSRPHLLWVSPDDATDPGHDEHGPTMLDVSGFHGDVSITGLPPGRVVVDPARHAVVRPADLRDVDWTGLGLSPVSWWRLLARKVLSDGVAVGIYSVPAAGSPSHEGAVRDLGVLRAHGHLR